MKVSLVKPLQIKKSTFRLIFASAVFLYVLLLILHFVGIEFESVKVAHNFSLIYIRIPLFLSVLLAFYVKRGALKILTYSILAFVLLISIIIFFFWMITYYDIEETGVDLAREKIHAIHLANKDLVVYRTNCGATCSFGLEVNEERTLISGIKYSKNILSFYPGYDIEFEINSDSVKIKSLEGVEQTDEANISRIIKVD
jgi:hypothetical protein